MEETSSERDNLEVEERDCFGEAIGGEM